MSVPFTPAKHSRVTLTLGDTTQSTPVADASTVWVDNRGATDVLVEFFDAPLDADSYLVPAESAQPLSRPYAAIAIYVKRPAGAATEDVHITKGYGI